MALLTSAPPVPSRSFRYLAPRPPLALVFKLGFPLFVCSYTISSGAGPTPSLHLDEYVAHLQSTDVLPLCSTTVPIYRWTLPIFYYLCLELAHICRQPLHYSLCRRKFGKLCCTQVTAGSQNFVGRRQRQCLISALLVFEYQECHSL